jgi:polysaccharide biosynthesis protein VpsM
MKRATLLLAVLWCLVHPAWAENPPSSIPENESESLSYDLFDGGRQGYLHPFLEIGVRYTDNLFLEPNARRQDTITVISPGLWLALPASREEYQPLATLTRAPGGLEVQRILLAPERRLQGFAFWRSRIEEHRDFTEENSDSHSLQGLLQYQAPAGLYLQATGAFDRQFDDYATGIFRGEQRDRFDSTLAAATIGYRPGERLRLALDYSKYLLSYREERSTFRDREDRVWSGTIAYRLLTRTETFVQYRHVDVDYDLSEQSDSSENHYFVGLQWQGTVKSRGRLQVGYGDKRFAEAETPRRQEFIAEARVDHRFTERTSVYLQGWRKTNETDIRDAEDLRSHRLLMGYEQRLSSRLKASARISYGRDQYRGGTVGRRDDDYYGGGAELAFAPRRWLRFTVGYDYAERQAGDGDFDYRRNMGHLGVMATF